MFGLQVAVVVIAALYFAREVLIPITLAVLLSFVLAPIVGFLRGRLGRTAAAVLAMLFALGVISGIGAIIGTQVAQLASNVPQYAQVIEGKVEVVRKFTIGRIGAFSRSIDRGAPAPPAAAPASPNDPKIVPVEVHQPTPSPIELAERFLTPVLSPLATLGIVLVVSMFILLQQDDLRDRLIRLFGSNDLHRTTLALDDGGRRLSRYFLTQLAINTSFGIVIGVGLYFIGVPSPVLWGILSGLLRFVPYVGSFLSAAFPVALAAAVDPGWSMLVWTVGLYLVVEPILGQVIEPLLYGHSTGLSPFAVVVSAIFWSWLWGPIGLILSTPMTLCLVVLGRHVDRLEFLEVLLGDKPALTPIESFYQRILAGDADEALDHAEALLKERSLTSYYDEVALKGLQLAANDGERGVLNHNQLETIKHTVNGLVHDLDSHADVDPPPPSSSKKGHEEDESELPKRPAPDERSLEQTPLLPSWQVPVPVLCLAGRGPLDEAAAGMLSQLLAKHGLNARLAPYQAASRELIGGLDVTGVAMICISYLDIAGSPSHLRYLMRRLRQKAPGVPILVGLWPSEDAVLKDERVRAVVGADYYTTTLHEAVDACLHTAHGANEAPRAQAA